MLATYLASLIRLGTYAPGGGGDTSLGGSALAAGVLGIFTAVAGLILGFIAAVRR